MINNILIKFVIIISIFLPSIVLAGSFKTVPIKLFFDMGSKTSVLRITNQGDEKVTVQLNAKEWHQDDAGQDVYNDTKDIVFFPKMADIEKGEERIIRVGYQGQSILNKEKTYRLFLEELPVSKPGEMALKFALKLGIPIFVKPQEETIEWAINGVDLSEEKLTVKIQNSGNTHFIVSKITAAGIDESGNEVLSKDITGWYTLPGASKFFSMPISLEECMSIKAINVAVEVEKTSKETRLDVDNTMCSPAKKGADDLEKEGVTR